MSAEALRSVFLELGFDIDLPTLEKAEAAVKKATKTTQDSAKASDKASKDKKKAAADDEKGAKKILTAEERVAKVREKAAEERAEWEAKKTFDASAEGKEHTAWQRRTRDAKAWALGIVGAAAVAARAMLGFAREFAQTAEDLRDTSIESRVTTTELQELRHAAVMGGVGIDRMNSAIATFGQGLRAGERWGSGTTRMLRRLGITTRDAAGHIRPTGELLNETAIALQRIENPYRRLRVAQRLFGESARRMLDILHTGPGGIAALRAELEELGGGVTPEAVAASREYTQATERLSRAQDSLRSVLAVALLPALSWIARGLASLGGLLSRLTRGTHVVQVALAGLGVVGVAVAASLIAAWAPVLAPYLGIAAAVAAVVAILDDLITFVEGGDSATGRLIDTMFGVGTASEYVHELREEWEAVQEALSGAIGAVANFLGLQEEVATNVAPPRGTPGATGRRPRVREAGTTTVARTGPGGTVTVPATRTVGAPGSVVSSTRTITRNHTSAPVMHFHGVTDARRIAGEVRDVIRSEDQQRRDADHPTEDEE